MRANEKYSSTSFIEVDTSHRMVPLRMLCIVTLTYKYRGNSDLALFFQDGGFM